MGPKILFYDIETTPNLSHVWGHWQQNVIAHVQEWRILCFSYQWAGERSVHYSGQNSFATYYKKNPECDLKVVEHLHKLFDEADILIAHNGDQFDKRKSNSRFLVHGMAPPAPYQTVDTLKQARRHFKFNSNRLTDLGQILGLGAKAETGGFKLWQGCMSGDPKSWATMEKYAKQDVKLLVKVYNKLLPWMNGHPNAGLYITDTEALVCPTCGKSNQLIKRGYSYKQTRRYQRYQCKCCGRYSASVTSDIVKARLK